MTLQVKLDGDVTPVSGDPDRLQQVLWNLLSNAVKFTPEGGRILVQVEETDGHVDVVVSDTGIGIASAFLPHLFERFRQADGGTTRAHGGLGLGLAIARHLVELHGGTITGTSLGGGQGATFRVRLPISGDQVEPMPIDGGSVHGEQRALRRSAESSLRGFHILAIDDDDDGLTLVREILEAAGARVSAVRSGGDALQQIQHLKPDLLVADLGLPLMDGFEMIRRVRQLPDRSVSGIVAIALTAYAGSEDRVKALESGFQLHIAKPLDPQELVNAATALLGRRDPH